MQLAPLVPRVPQGLLEQSDLPVPREQPDLQEPRELLDQPDLRGPRDLLEMKARRERWGLRVRQVLTAERQRSR